MKSTMIGRRYGKLVVTAADGLSATCQCDCGNVHTVARSNLYNERTQSCGCARRGPRGPRGQREPLTIVNPKGDVKPLAAFLALPANHLGTAEQKRVYEVCKCLTAKDQPVTVAQARAVMALAELF